jgi:hypothetical protein
VGPEVPFPNVTGTVVRDGVPVVDIEVELEDTVADTTYEDERTDSEGRFAFREIGPGAWTVRVDSDEEGDFGRVTYEFVFTTQDTSVEVPLLDVSQKDLELEKPQDGDVRDVPSIFDSMEFEWDWEATELPRFQIRLYVMGGPPLWFSSRDRVTRMIWNGLANEGDNAGEFVQPGLYRWHLRVEGEGALEYRTADRFITFE